MKFPMMIYIFFNGKVSDDVTYKKEEVSDDVYLAN